MHSQSLSGARRQNRANALCAAVIKYNHLNHFSLIFLVQVPSLMVTDECGSTYGGVYVFNSTHNGRPAWKKIGESNMLVYGTGNDFQDLKNDDGRWVITLQSNLVLKNRYAQYYSE